MSLTVYDFDLWEGYWKPLTEPERSRPKELKHSKEPNHIKGSSVAKTVANVANTANFGVVDIFNFFDIVDIIGIAYIIDIVDIIDNVDNVEKRTTTKNVLHYKKDNPLTS